jgi:uncharacterized protein (DUF2236 family)
MTTPSNHLFASPETPAVVRRIWGSVDAIILIFAGSAAEFALSRAVDWLFWTNRLPDAPIERFFETVRFAQTLVFEGPAGAEAAIAAVNGAHRMVERSRDAAIPQWAYRHVLSMLIDYGEQAHRIVFGPMSEHDRAVHFTAMLEIGCALRIAGLPTTYDEYRAQRQAHLQDDIAYGEFSAKLYARYRDALGGWRFRALLRLQASLVPAEVARLLGLRRRRGADLLLRVYRHLPRHRLLRVVYPLLLSRRYARQLASLDRCAGLGTHPPGSPKAALAPAGKQLAQAPNRNQSISNM